MYMNKCQIIKCFDKGWMQEVKQQCTLYGKIISVKDWQIDNILRYNGCWRQYKIEHHSMLWVIEMHNGEVREISMEKM